MNFIKNLRDLRPMDAKQRYKFHRTARYLLAVPMVFLLDWWAAALILAVLPFEGALRIAVFAAIFAILACALLWYLFKRYKNFKPSKLFVKNPNLSLLFFTVENLSLGAFCGGFFACLAAWCFWASVPPTGAHRLHLRSLLFVCSFS